MTFSEKPLDGSGLEEKTVCLTFDDGPASSSTKIGPHTLELAQYLQTEGISATFFVVGANAFAQPELLTKVASLGHTIGNHSCDHVGLSTLRLSEVTDQIAPVSLLLERLSPEKPVLFRAPYGEWNADIAKALNANFGLALTTLGPVGWDIATDDWKCWQDGDSAEICADRLMQKLHSKPRHSGIILAHDNTSDGDLLAAKNNCLLMVQRLIPLLKLNNFKSQQLYNLPSIKAAAKPFKVELFLIGKGMQFPIAVQSDGIIRLENVSTPATSWTVRRVNSAKQNQVIFELGDKRVMSVNKDNLLIATDKTQEAAKFDTVSQTESRVLLRHSDTGKFLVRTDDATFTIDSRSSRDYSEINFKICD